MFFSRHVDMRKKDAVQNFLRSHKRYHTMNSWNRSTSFAHNVKLRNLGLTKEQEDTAHDILGADDTSVMNEIEHLISDFTAKMEGCYTIGFNGRSSGYLVLYKSEFKSSDYKSYCTCCGQRNFKLVMPEMPDGPDKVVFQELVRTSATFIDSTYLTQSAVQALSISDDEKLALVRKHRAASKGVTIDNRCGACGQHARKNYAVVPKLLGTFPGRSIGEDLEDMSFYELQSLAKVVQAFDAACDEIRDCFISACSNLEVVEEEIQVTKKVRVLKEKATPVTQVPA